MCIYTGAGERCAVENLRPTRCYSVIRSEWRENDSLLSGPSAVAPKRKKSSSSEGFSVDRYQSALSVQCDVWIFTSFVSFFLLLLLFLLCLNVYRRRQNEGNQNLREDETAKTTETRHHTRSVQRRIQIILKYNSRK